MSSFDRIKFWCPDRLQNPVTFELRSEDSLGATLFNDFSCMEGFTCSPDWRITFCRPNSLQKPVTFEISSADLIEATRWEESCCLLAVSTAAGSCVTDASGGPCSGNGRFNKDTNRTLLLEQQDTSDCSLLKPFCKPYG